VEKLRMEMAEKGLVPERVKQNIEALTDKEL